MQNTMENIVLNGVLQQLNKSHTELSPKNINNIKENFPIPREYKVLWADVQFASRISGFVITDKALIIKADKETLKEYNKSCADKKDNQNAIYHLIKWEYFDPDDFEIQTKDEKTVILYNKAIVLSSEGLQVSTVFEYYESETQKFIKAATVASANVFSNFESVVPANFARVNSKTGHGLMAEKALTLIDKLMGRQAKVIGDDNAKNGADRLVDGIQIQTKYCDTGVRCINDCFDKTTGSLRYVNSDGKPMQIEVPSDKYYEALNAFREKILEGKVPGVTNPDDATKYVRKGKLTYLQALNLCKAGTIESLSYDAATGFICCSFAFGITFLTTYIICYAQNQDRKEAMKEAALAGVQVFGLSFMNHILCSQIARTTLTNQLIPMSTYLVENLGYKVTQNIVNAIRFMTGKVAISGAAATKQLAKILRGNVVTSTITFVVFSAPDTFNMFSKKISVAQYTKNMLSLVGTMAAGAGGTMAAALVGAKVGALTGTTIAPGVGTTIGLTGGLASGLAAGAIIKALGDKIREDDSVILSRMFNGIVVNLVYEYMLQETELDELLEKFSQKKPKEFKKLFKDLMAEKEFQDKKIDTFIRPYFEEIITKRERISAPTSEDVMNLLKQLSDDIGETPKENFSIFHRFKKQIAQIFRKIRNSVSKQKKVDEITDSASDI